MKTLITIVTITAALTLPGTGARPRLIPPPDPEVQDAVATEAEADKQLQRAQQEIERAQSKIDRRAAEVEARQAEVEQAAAAAADAEASVPPVPDLPVVPMRLQNMIHR